VGRAGVFLIVAGTAAALTAARSGRFGPEAPYFLPPLCIVALLALIDAWDLVVGLAALAWAPYLVLPDLDLPGWLAPVGQWLTPVVLLGGVLAGHFLWP
jgi:hypothetical protein